MMAVSPTEQIDQFMVAVGRGLWAWSEVEDGMFQLFMQVSGTDRQRAILIFNTIIGFETRLSVLNALMQQMLADETEREVWIKLAARLQKFYKKRHQLAHFGIVNDINVDKNPHVHTVRFHPLFTFGGFLTGANKMLSLAEIKERTEKFKELKDALFYFLLAFMAAGQPQEYSPPVPDLIQHLRKLAAHSPEEHGGQLPPSAV